MTQHNHWNHFGLVLAGLVMLYLLAAVGAGAFYSASRCPYGSLSACQVANKNQCGNPVLASRADCQRFVEGTENCYCNACKNCLTPQLLDHCALSVTDRVKACQQQVPQG